MHPVPGESVSPVMVVAMIEVELIGRDARVFQRALGRFHRHVHIRFRLADVAGAHADALCDPFIVGVYKRREVVVRHNMLRRVAACT